MVHVDTIVMCIRLGLNFMVFKKITCIVPARNEAGNLPGLISRISNISAVGEILIIEGGSKDNTWKVSKDLEKKFPNLIHAYQQSGKGKFNAVLFGAQQASYETILIWDADGTVPFSDTLSIIAVGSSDFKMVTGDRLRGKMAKGSMRRFNWLGNWFFAITFIPLLRKRPLDLLCGTKIMPRIVLTEMPSSLVSRDPFGDFAMFLNSKWLGIPIESIPVSYDARTYGQTNIKRWSSGLILLRLLFYAYFAEIQGILQISWKSEKE